MALETFPFELERYLRSDEEIALFLEAAMEDGDPQGFAYALQTAARAKGVAFVGNTPTFDTLMRVLSASGLRLRFDHLAA